MNVVNHYRNMRMHQTVDFVKYMTDKYTKFDHPLMIWDAMESLNNLVDLSDPDLDLPNIQHLFQSAEAMRQQGLSGELAFVPRLLTRAKRTARVDASDCAAARFGKELVLVGLR